MRRQTLALIAVLAAVAFYVVLFFAVPMPSLKGIIGEAIGGVARRWRFLWLYFAAPEFLIQSWFGAPGEGGILDRLPVLALASGIVATAACLGWLLLVLIGAERRLARLEVFVFSTAVGLTTISTYVLAVGLVGMVRSRAIFLVPGLLVLTAAGWLYARRRNAERKPRPRGRNLPARLAASDSRSKKGQAEKLRSRFASHSPPAAPSADWLSPRWLWLAVPFVVMFVLSSVLPPLAFDVREYHLQVPKEFFLGGSIGFLPHNVYGNMAMGTEMLSLLAMTLSGDWWLGSLVGKTIIALFAPLAALGLLAAGRRFFSPTAGIVAAVVYLATPWVPNVSTTGLVEGASAFYLLLAVYAMLLWQEGTGDRGQGAGEKNAKCKTAEDRASSALAPHASLLLLAGYLAGGAVATKYPAALFVFLPLAIWSVVVSARNGWGHTLRHLTLFTLAAAVACGLWFGKNWALIGNPTYPLLNSVFHSPQWSAEQETRFNLHHRAHDFSLSKLGECAESVAITSEWLSPILMPLAALGLFSVLASWPRGEDQAAEARREHWVVAALAVNIAFVLATWWLLTHRIDRFWIPVLPLFALLAGRGTCWRADRPWRWAVGAMLILTAAFGFLVDASGGGCYNRFFVALEYLRTSPDRVNVWHNWLNTHAADGRVLLVGDAEPFDLNMPVLYNTTFDKSIFEQIASGRTPEEVRDELIRRDVAYVFVDWRQIARYRSPNNYGFTDFVQPEVLDTLVANGVLRPMPSPPESVYHAGKLYSVVQEGR